MNQLSFVLWSSVILQVIAVILAVRLVPVTKKTLAWAVLSLAFLLMAVRRSIALLHLDGIMPGHWMATASSEFVALLISFLVVVGVYLIGDIFLQLRKSENRLKEQAKIIDQINDAIIMTDVNGLITSCNSGAERMFGYPKKQMCGRHISFLYPDEDQVVFHKQIIEPLLEKEVLEAEVRMKKSTGETIFAHFSLSLSHDAQGERSGMIGYVLDVTDRKQSEIEIARLASIVTNSPDFIGMCDVNGCMYYLNHAGRELVGIGDDERSIYTEVPKYFSDDYRDMVCDDVIPAVLENGRWSGEVGFCDFVSGEHIPVWFDMFRVDEPSTGRPINMVIVSRDLREQKAIEQALHFSENRFQKIADATPVGIFQTDPQGKCIYVNEAYRRITGLNAKEVQGDGWVDAIYPDDRDNVLAEWNAAVEENRPISLECRISQSDGSVMWVYSQSLPEYNKKGEVVSYVGTLTDITESKLTETEIENYSEVLERMVDQRSRQLLLALDEAERANAAKSRFLSHMSHELRTPLNAILGFGQLLMMDAETLTENQQSNVTEILEAGEHLLTLVNSILDLARIESGKMELSIEPVSVDDLLRQCLVMTRTQAEIRHITIKDNVSGNGYVVLADRVRLKQAIVNLLCNAIKYNCENGDVILNGEPNEEQCLCISVSDTGQGLTADKLRKLFQPFVQLHSDRDIEGTGIGLVITRHIIELMGGKIDVESTVGKGSTFRLEIDLAQKVSS